MGVPLRIAYICCAGADVGFGHLARGHALVSIAAPGSCLVVRGDVGRAGEWVGTQLGDVLLRGWRNESEPLSRDQLSAFDSVLVDDSQVRDAWIRAAEHVAPVVVVDDWVRTTVDFSALLNPNLGATVEDYSVAPESRLFCGSRFVLLREEVLSKKPRTELSRSDSLVVTLGASDPDDVTSQVVHTLLRTSWYLAGGHIICVLGPSYRGALRAGRCRSWGRGCLTLLSKPVDFVDLCLRSDLVVCGASTTSYEMAYLGCPFVPLGFIGNQFRLAVAWERAGVGSGLTTANAEWSRLLRDEVDMLLDSSDSRRVRTQSAARAVDGLGRLRVLNGIGELIAKRREREPGLVRS